jgi:hypothetical protein
LILFIAAASAQDAPWEERLAGGAIDIDVLTDSSFGVSGVAIEAIGGNTGLAVKHASVAGNDGGTHAVTAVGDVVWDRYKVSVGMPMATFRTSQGARGALGNMTAAAYVIDDSPNPEWQIGVQATLRTGRAYTWVNEAHELWPDNGLDVIYLRRIGDGSLHGAVRTALGIHAPSGWDPYPDVFARLNLAGLIEQNIGKQAGVLGEASLTWWDVSPIDLSAMAWAEPVDGMRLRGGVTLPVASWAGWQPARVPAGARETTLRLELVVKP